METVYELINACDEIQYEQTGRHFTTPQHCRVWNLVRCYCKYLIICCMMQYIDTGDTTYIDALKTILKVFCVKHGKVMIDKESQTASDAMRLIMGSLYDAVPVEQIADAIINRPADLVAFEKEIRRRQSAECGRRSRY